MTTKATGPFLSRDQLAMRNVERVELEFEILMLRRPWEPRWLLRLCARDGRIRRLLRRAQRAPWKISAQGIEAPGGNPDCGRDKRCIARYRQGCGQIRHRWRGIQARIELWLGVAGAWFRAHPFGSRCASCPVLGGPLAWKRTASGITTMAAMVAEATIPPTT